MSDYLSILHILHHNLTFILNKTLLFNPFLFISVHVTYLMSKEKKSPKRPLILIKTRVKINYF